MCVGVTIYCKSTVAKTKPSDFLVEDGEMYIWSILWHF
nr:MAG TPA: hypothetical protein [Bacteriophage sp.]